ncbi:MAG: 5-oxoprolinase subunit PxpB [Phycisphaerae bacterium]
MNPAAPFDARWISERHLRLAGPPLRDAAMIHACCAALRRAAIPGLVDLAAAHSSILIEFDFGAVDADDAAPEFAEAAALAALRDIEQTAAPVGETIVIPVCFAPQFAPDLAESAARAQLSIDAFIGAFVSAAYAVRFLGFAPGFAYLDGLPTPLATPRHDSPRPRVAAGSVGIAGNQTGIYPHDSPGGWQLIGRTPLRMFNVDRPRAALLQAGDRMRFVVISADEFDRMSREPA